MTRDDNRFALRTNPDNPNATPGSKVSIGYWHSKYQPQLPDPHAFIDESWDPAEREAVAAYFDGGEDRNSYRGWSDCRICGKPNGSSDKTNGKLVWPSGFSHYIRQHSVRPPQPIVDIALAGRKS